MGEKELLGARIDDTLKRLVDADSRTNQEVVARALWNEYGGERKGAIETRIEHKENRIKQVKSEIHDLQDELEEIQSEKAALEDQLEDIGDRKEAYKDALDEVLDSAESGERSARIVPATLNDIAKEHAKDPDDVHSDIKQRAVEQERRLSTTAFVSPQDEPDIVAGPVAEIWGDSDE
jgi:predicted nuclease with TOPRIM domain